MTKTMTAKLRQKQYQNNRNKSTKGTSTKTKTVCGDTFFPRCILIKNFMEQKKERTVNTFQGIQFYAKQEKINLA